MEFKMQAALQGVDLNSEENKVKESVNTKNPIFGSPDDYKDLSDTEKEAITQKMMGKHKSWVGRSALGE